MKMKSLVLLAMAIGCGLVAMLGVQQVLSGDKKPPAETGKVLVAITNIMPGQPLDDSNVAFKAWDKNDIPQGAVTTHEEYQERSLTGLGDSERAHHDRQVEREGGLWGIERNPERDARGHSAGDRHRNAQRPDLAGGPGRRRRDLHRAPQHAGANEQPVWRNQKGQDHPAVSRGLCHRQYPTERRS